MTQITPIAWAVHLDCIYPSCQIFLPPRSPLGTYGHQLNLSTGTWPATFLCLKHRRASVREPGHAHPSSLVSPIPNFYQIEAVCGQVNCERHHVLFAAGEANSTDIKRKVLHDKPAIDCNGHDLIWTDRVRVIQKHPDVAHLP
jgi:hypothetical protein